MASRVRWLGWRHGASQERGALCAVRAQLDNSARQSTAGAACVSHDSLYRSGELGNTFRRTYPVCALPGKTVLYEIALY